MINVDADEALKLLNKDKLPDVQKQHEFNTFVQWMSLPATLKGKSKEKLLELGIDESMHELLDIKTQTQFSERYEVSQATLSSWKKKLSFNEGMLGEVKREVFQKYFARIAHSFSMHVIKHGDAARVKLWFETFAENVIGEDDVTVDKEGEEQEASLVISTSEIATLVKLRMKESRGMDVEDVDFEDIPKASNREYDFEAIKRIHEKKPKVEASKPNDSERLNVDDKQALLDRIKGITAKKKKK